MWAGILVVIMGIPKSKENNQSSLLNVFSYTNGAGWTTMCRTFCGLQRDCLTALKLQIAYLGSSKQYKMNKIK